MQKALKTHLETRFPYLKSQESLLAISGGRDSMALAHLLHALNYKLVLAHCNFMLRKSESDADAAFIKAWAKKRDLPCYVQSFETNAFAKANGISTQMAARELRYAWFESLRKELGCPYILTAHHADDTAETFFINLSRGTGLDGLQGIPEQNDAIIRPLLRFSRKQIDAYIKKNHIDWREDASNETDNYLRNHLRHHAIPALKEAAPNISKGLAKTLHNLKASQSLLEDYMALVYPKVVSESFKGYQLNINELQKLPHTREVLYELLKGFNFTAWDDIYDLLNAQPGKRVLSATHRLIKDRDVLLLTENLLHTPAGEAEGENKILVNKKDKKLFFEGLRLTQEAVSEFEIKNTNEAIFDLKDLDYPLSVRKWEQGDYFYPFGMRGKKKLSKYFKDQKLSTLAKETVWLLCNGDEIIWVMGYRSDERYRVSDKTEEFIKFTIEHE